VVREFYEGVNRRDLAAVAPLIAEGCVYEDLVFPRPMVGRDSVVGFFGEFMGSVSPDLRFVIDDISGEDPFAVGVTWHLGTPQLEFPILPPSRLAGHFRLRFLNSWRAMLIQSGRGGRSRSAEAAASTGASPTQISRTRFRSCKLKSVDFCIPICQTASFQGGTCDCRYGRDCVEPATKPGDLALVRVCCLINLHCS
jgi:hypothetical protein